MTRTVSRRLSRLEERAAMGKNDRSISIRIRLVRPEEGCTGVLLLEAGQPTIEVPPTPEDIEEVRADVERRRAARPPWQGGATDTHGLRAGLEQLETSAGRGKCLTNQYPRYSTGSVHGRDSVRISPNGLQVLNIGAPRVAVRHFLSGATSRHGEERPARR